MRRMTWKPRCGQQIKAKRLDPREAFDKLTTDWVKYHDEVKPGQNRSR